MKSDKPIKPLKILLLGSKEYPFGSSYRYDRKAGGGIEIHVEKLAKYLAMEGNEVFILTRQFPGQKREETLSSGKDRIHVHRTKFLYNPLFRAMTFNLFAAKKARKLIRKKGIDLIHCHGPVAGFFGALLSKMTGKPMVFTPHGTVSTWRSPIREILRFFESFSVTKARKTIFISPTAQKELTVVASFPNILLTNAIDFDDYPSAKEIDGKVTRFLFLGRLEEVKGIRPLLDAFKLLSEKHTEVRLVIAGDGVMRGYIEEFIRKNKMEKNIEFLGWRTDVPRLLSENDAFVLPSWEKGQPVALLEAMASGKVIITSLDYISDMETGIKVRPGDTKDLYEKMLYACKNSDCRNLGSNARARAMGMAWELVIKSFLKEYKKVLDICD